MLTDKRLIAVCECIKPCSVFADVGCDHGKVSEYVAENKLAHVVLACDVSAKCLQKAKARLSRFDNVEFHVADGLKGIRRVDTAVICGMGAKTIMGIISALSYKPYLILGAQKNVEELRFFLARNGYRAEKDFVVEEDGVFYDVICACEGECEIDEIIAHEGFFYKQKDELRKKRLQTEIAKYSALYPSEKNKKLLEIAKEAYKWQS
ncbi:MAG: SAM-dependent methyltransferase [Clostridia bacterium]|nr:SAM-dependent methyltransferase [Clostridia bacterium]